MQGSDAQEANRSFSVELASKNQIKNISLAGESKKASTLIEGTIGSLVEASFADGIVLEVKGTKGVLRIDLQEKELRLLSE